MIGPSELVIPVHPRIYKDLEEYFKMTDRRTNWPVVIFPARYGGIYEGAPWLAIASRDVPEFAQGGDVDCARFYELNSDQIGRGIDPTSALENLVEKVGYDRNDFLNEFEPAEQETWYT